MSTPRQKYFPLYKKICQFNLLHIFLSETWHQKNNFGVLSKNGYLKIAPNAAQHFPECSDNKTQNPSHGSFQVQTVPRPSVVSRIFQDLY